MRQRTSGGRSRRLRESTTVPRPSGAQLTRSSAVTASSLYLSRFAKTSPQLLAKASGSVIPPVLIDPSAQIDPSAKVGPNVAIGPNCIIGEGCRVKDAIILEGTVLEKNAAVLDSIVGMNCHIGPWARVDGFAEPEPQVKGQISVTVLGESSSSYSLFVW